MVTIPTPPHDSMSDGRSQDAWPDRTREWASTDASWGESEHHHSKCPIGRRFLASVSLNHPNCFDVAPSAACTARTPVQSGATP